MSIRSFLFCDVCNPMRIRSPEQRRDRRQDGRKSGRRITDARSWIESTSEQAVAEFFWVVLEGGFHVCPDCNAKNLKADAGSGNNPSFRTFVFCDFCNPQGFRIVENRRDVDRARRTGRRISDGRAWLDAVSDDEVIAHNWFVVEGRHCCPDCFERNQT